MEDYISKLTRELQLIEKLRAKADDILKKSTSPNNVSVRTVKRKNGYQYYFAYPDGTRKYVKEKDIGLVRNIVQKEYALSVNAALDRLKNSSDTFLKNHDIRSVINVYTDLCPGKRELVTPFIAPDDLFISKWREDFCNIENSYPKPPGYITEQGEEVRSKSEKIIADMLYKYGVPYVYEPFLEFPDGTSCFPDFAALNKKARHTIYWEHFGMISDEEYAVKSLHKAHKYMANGLMPGEDFIFSTEGAEAAFSTKTIDMLIRRFLL